MSNHSILVVDDDPAAIQVMGRLVQSLGTTRVATNGADALRLARESAPSLVLLDAEMPGMSGFRVCEELKSDRSLSEVPVIFVTSHDDPDFELTSFKLGAADFIAKPVTPTLALARISAHLHFRHRADAMRQLVRVDALTNTINRLGFNDALRREWRRSLRSGEPISLLLVDVDHFAQLGETRGMPEADRCLQVIARALTRLLQRPADLLARVGGNTFGLLLPITPRGGAEHVAHVVLDAVESLQVPFPASPVANHVTVSVGIGCHDSMSVGWIEPSPDSRFAGLMRNHGRADDLLQAAEVSLRAAKLGGRAQAWLLDAADVDVPRLTREISAGARSKRGRRHTPGTH